MRALFDDTTEPAKPTKARPPAPVKITAPPAQVSAEIIGPFTGEFVCPDITCRCTSADMVAIDGWQCLAVCCCCATGRWMPKPKESPKSDKEFVFRGGQHDGQTVAQVLAKPGGRRYIEWAAESHPREFVREQVKIALALSHEIE